MPTSEETGVLVFVLAAALLLILLIVACCHRYFKLKQIRATASMLPDWDGHTALNDQPIAGPSYMPAPAGNFQPIPNVLYTGSPYHHPLPAHVQYYQQHLQTIARLPNASDREDHLCTTPGAYQLNQQAALSTPNVVGCFYGAAYVPTNPYGPTTYGLVEHATAHPHPHLETAAIIHQTGQHDVLPPSYDQAMYAKTGMTAVSD